MVSWGSQGSSAVATAPVPRPRERSPKALAQLKQVPPTPAMGHS